MSDSPHTAAGTAAWKWTPRVKSTVWRYIRIPFVFGADLFGWLRMLARHRFAVQWLFWPTALLVTLAATIHTALRFVQAIFYGARVARTPVPPAPVFVIGHWRCGTTLLHELLALDNRFTAPTTYECFNPTHFLLTEWVTTRILPLPVSTRGAIDGMKAGWKHPQEDEFALCNLGAVSPMEGFVFPRDAGAFARNCLPGNLSDVELARWKRLYLRFVKQVAFRRPGRRIVSKCPVHTFRVPLLLELFPDARFVHIVRDPFEVFPSMARLVRALQLTQGLQRPRIDAAFYENIFERFTLLHKTLDAARPLVPPGQFFEVRYEDLVREPVATVKAIYDHLGLGGFEQMLPALERDLAARSGYKAHSYNLPAEVLDEIERRWGAQIRTHGYERPAPASAAGCGSREEESR